MRKYSYLAWVFILVALLGAAFFVIKNESGFLAGRELTTSSPWFWLVLVSSALVDSINPCAFSILFITIAFLLSAGATRQKIVLAGLAYVFGIYFVYFSIGMIFSLTAHAVALPHNLAKFGAFIIIVFGAIGLAGEIWPSFPIRLKIPQFAHRSIAQNIHQATYAAAFLLGAIVGLAEFPCTGGPYTLALTLLHDATTFWKGIGYLALYNLIFVLPLVITVFLASQSGALEKIQAWRKSNGFGRFIGSIVALALGFLLLLL